MSVTQHHQLHAARGTLNFFQHHRWLLDPRHRETRDPAVGAIERASRMIERLEPMEYTVPQIICSVFGDACAKALAVANCESHFYTGASNGQYKGIFQMGEHERARFGDGADAWSQARAAYRYYQLSGWAPWACA